VKYESHPAADMFPMMSSERLAELAEDIRRNGQRVPVVVCDGKILDGRNRAKACAISGLEPSTVEFTGGNPFEYVWSLNGNRRDLDPGQRAAIRLRADKASDEWERAKGRRKVEANQRRSEAATEQHRVSNPRTGEKSGRTSEDVQPERRPNPNATELASRAGVSEATAARVQSIASHRPDLLDAVADGTIRLSEASRQVKRETLSSRVAALPEGKHRVIYADPPWKYGDDRGGLTGGNAGGWSYEETSAAGQYPTMSVADLCALDVRAVAADDSVLFCWATFPLLPDALIVVKAWGFTYKTAFVWDKQRSNLGNYHDARAELLLVCTRGSVPTEIDERPPQVQSIPRGKHSAKPELFRQLIDKMYPTGPRIELFRRGEIPSGWSAWGNEVSDSAA
jgi:N6-adenosine-specific RNA methylase IME4